MKINIFPLMGLGVWATQESIPSEKKTIEIELVVNGARTSGILFIGGRAYPCEGVCYIPISALPDGNTPVKAKVSGKYYPIGSLLREGTRVVTRSEDDHALIVQALTAAETAYRVAMGLDARIKELERNSNGVDLMNLS